MPKKKPTLGDPGPESPAPDSRSPGEREQERQEQQLVDLIHRTKQDDGIVALRRRAVNDVEFGHLAEMSASAFSEENVRKIYGGGDYKLQFKTAAGKFVGSSALKIDYSIPPQYPGAVKPNDDRSADRGPELIKAVTEAIKNNTPPPPPAADNSLLIEVLRQNAAMTQAALARPQAPASDPALTALLAEMRAEQRETRAALAELKNNRGGADGFKEIEKFLKIQELIGGGDSDAPAAAEKPDRITTILTALAPALAPIVARMVAGGAAAAAGDMTAGALPALTEGQPSLNPAPVQPAAEDMNVLIKIYLGEFRRLALTAAAKGRNAFEWADTKIDDIDPKYHAKIFELANAEDWFKQLFGDDPAAGSHVQWLIDMRNGILTRAFVIEVTSAAREQPSPTPEVFAKRFLDKASVSWHDTVWNLTSPEAWGETFARSGIESHVWLESLRVAFENELSEGDEPEAKAAEPVTPPPAAAAAKMPGAKPPAAARRKKAGG